MNREELGKLLWERAEHLDPGMLDSPETWEALSDREREFQCLCAETVANAVRAEVVAPQWISASTPPEFTGIVPDDEFSDEVLVHWPNDTIGIGQFWRKDGWYWVEQDEGHQADADPTHWMPLPQPPVNSHQGEKS